MAGKNTVEESKYEVRYFDGDNVIFTHPYDELEPACYDAVLWNYEPYEPDEEEGAYGIDYVEVLRNNPDGTAVRCLWMNTDADEGIELKEDDPDYEIAERILDKNR